MFCEKCGAQMDNDSKFCLSCGAQVTPAAEPVAAPVAAPAAPAGPSFFSNKKNVLILAIAAVVIIVGIIVAVVIGNLPATIYMDDYITIRYEGLSTRGEAYMEFNSEAFKAALMEEMSEYEFNTMMARMTDTVLELEVPENLTNGNEIHIVFYINNEIAKDYGVQFKLKNETVTVDSLQEPVFLDLFADIELTFTGCSPYSDVTFVNNSTNEFIKEYVYYYIDNQYELEEGEKFTIRANFSSYDAEQKGYIILEDTKEYTATNLPKPVELNPFDYVEVNFTGLEGSGRATYQKTGDIDFMDRISFTFNKYNNLAEGEVITLAFSHSSYVDPLEYGYILPETTTKQFTVPKLGQYITDFTQLTEAGQAAAIAGALEEAKYHLTKEDPNDNNTSYVRLYNTGFDSLNELTYATGLSNVKLHSVVSAQDQGWWSTTNYLYFIFTVDITGHSNLPTGNGTGYFFLYTSNPIMKGDGTLEFDFENDSLNYYRNCFLSYEDLSGYQFSSYEVVTPYIPAA